MADGIISKIQLPDNTIYDVVDNTSGYMTGMTILSYGSSTWQNFIDAYSSNKVVYCRASSNANPATGSQTRLAFMAYVNNATTPTEVEFQYYRSVSSHTASQQGDQVFVYKLSQTNGWSVTVREASVKVVAGTGLGGTYSNGTMTLTGPTKVSDLTNDSGFIITETDPTVPSWAKESTKPSYNFSEIGNTPTTLSGYGITNAYTKTEVDGLVSGVLHYKGTKTTTSALPSSGNTTGDVWHVTADGSEWAWDGSTWQELGTAVDLSGYLQSSDIASWAKQSTKPSYSLSEITGTSDLQAIEGLTGTSGLLKKTAADTWTLDTNTYLTSFTETDPVFSASAAAGITSSDISNWNSKTSNTGTVTSVGISNATNGGLSISGSPVTDSGSITVGHSNILTSAQSTSAVYPITIDKNGHIASYGSAVTIPTTSGKTATLTTTWTSNQQTVTVSGVTSSNYVVVSPAPASYDDYCEAGIYCSAQGTNSLTFKCDTVPSAALTVNIMIVN